MRPRDLQAAYRGNAPDPDPEIEIPTLFLHPEPQHLFCYPVTNIKMLSFLPGSSTAISTVRVGGLAHFRLSSKNDRDPLSYLVNHEHQPSKQVASGLVTFD
jgi:hypothetical protein